MSSTPLQTVPCPYCGELTMADRVGLNLCHQCGRKYNAEFEAVGTQRMPDEEIDRAREEDETAAERAVYGREGNRRDRAITAATAALVPLLQGLITNYVPGMGPSTPTAGKIECQDCADWLAGMRDAHHQLSAHLESAHEWWPADMEAALAEYAKAGARVARGLRSVRFTEQNMVGVDPYAAARRPDTVVADGQAPDTTGTAPNSRERLDAVLDRTGPSPLYDPTTDDLEPATPAVHVVADDTPGGFLDGGGDAAPAPEPEPTPAPA